MLPAVFSFEGMAVGSVWFKGLVMLAGAVDGPGLLVLVTDGDGVPSVTEGGIVVNWPKVAVTTVESPGPVVAEAEAATDACADSPASVRPGVRG